jgi:hypothetical protein
MSRLDRVQRALSALEGLVLAAHYEAALPEPLESNAVAAELGELRGAIVGWTGRIRARLEFVRSLSRPEMRARRVT